MPAMTVLIDTNVILDVLCNRPAFVQDSAAVMRLCETGRVCGAISALSVPNIMYILRKELTPERSREIITLLTQIFSIADLKGKDLTDAFRLQADTSRPGIPDYEDALQCVAAARIKADCIVTRNTKDFRNSPVPALSPDDFLRRHTL